MGFIGKTTVLGFAAALLIGCSSSKPSSGSKNDDILELLTRFSELITGRDYERALAYLTPEDQMKIRGMGSRVPPEMQQRLSALPLQRLTINPNIRAQNGKIHGIYDALPVIRQGSMEEVALAIDTTDAPSFIGGESAPVDDYGNGVEANNSWSEQEHQTAIKALFAAIDSKNWPSALNLIHENERTILVNARGEMTPEAKDRLAQIDRRSRNALVLIDGKITGISLLLPPSDN